MNLKVLVIGTGAYVCGRGSDGYGTVLPALYEFATRNKLSVSISFAYFSESGLKELKHKLANSPFSQNKDLQFSFICASDLDAVSIDFGYCIISVPDANHTKWCAYSINRGWPFLVVKPFTLNSSDARMLVAKANERGVKGHVEFHKRLDRQLRYARDTYQQGLIGDALYSYTEYTQPKNIPTQQFSRWAHDSNIFNYLGVHYVDAFYYVTKAIPARVSATGQYGYLKSHGIETYDSIQANVLWRLPDGMMASQTIMCNWIESNCSSAVSKQDFHLIGTTGRITCEMKDRGLSILTDDQRTLTVNPDFCRNYYLGTDVEYCGYGIDSVVTALEAAIDHTGILGRHEVLLCDLEQAVVSTLVIEGAARSLDSDGVWVNL